MNARQPSGWASGFGILAVNLGTPAAPTAAALRPYLRQFLSDPRVIDVNPILRWFLVNAIIVPFRSPKSAEAYREIWTEAGSPLLMHSRDLVMALAREFETIPVELGMRYGEPSIERALQALVAAGADRIVVLPLFPQYASASYGSAVEEVYRVAGTLPAPPALSVVPPYPDHPGFIDAVADAIRPHLHSLRPDALLLSYHGIPERHCERTDYSQGQHCFRRADCCAEIVAANRACYRAQCFQSSRAITRVLGLEPARVRVSFQSRLGRTPWIKPYTDELVQELPKQGVKRLVVACPSFTADCLETIEEIGIRARETFLAAGGEAFELAPCVNASKPWVQGAAALIREHLPAPIEV